MRGKGWVRACRPGLWLFRAMDDGRASGRRRFWALALLWLLVGVTAAAVRFWPEHGLPACAGHAADVGGVAGYGSDLRPAAGSRVPPSPALVLPESGLVGRHGPWRGHGVRGGGIAGAARHRRLCGGAQPAGVDRRVVPGEMRLSVGRRRAGGEAGPTRQCRAPFRSPAPSRRHFAVSAVHAVPVQSEPGIDTVRDGRTEHRQLVWQLLHQKVIIVSSFAWNSSQETERDPVEPPRREYARNQRNRGSPA